MKRFSTFAARDGFAVLYAKDETGKCSAFVIEKNVAGYNVSKIWKLMGGGGIEAVDVYLENMKVSKENLLGNKGQGFEILLSWIAMEKVEQCAACVGMAQAALNEAIKYAKSRLVRGKSISDMQYSVDISGDGIEDRGIQMADLQNCIYAGYGRKRLGDQGSTR